jgi:uncharacterized UBP type Zn finger protein
MKSAERVLRAGNTCFMNSILQALLHAPSMRAHYLSGGHIPSVCPAGRNQPCLSCELARSALSLFLFDWLCPHSLQELLSMVFSVY